MNVSKKTYLFFHLGHELFAIDVAQVKEIIEYSEPTQIPQSPDFMLGILNLRGQVLSVLDTKLRFGISATLPSAKSRIVVLEIAQQGQMYELGILVDSAHDVREVEEAAIQPPPEAQQIKHADFITGILKEKEGFVLIVDAQKVFSSILTEPVLQIN